MITHDAQLGLYDPRAEGAQPNITVVGAGTIGSWTVLCLAKMGFRNIRVIDFDTVEPHNGSNQLYGNFCIGGKKVEKLRQIVYTLTDVNIIADDTMITSPPILTNLLMKTANNIVISAVDSMKSRHIIYDAVADLIGVDKGLAMVNLLVDGRMGGNMYTVHFVDISRMEEYKKTLIPDDTKFENQEVQKTFELKCTERSIADVAFLCAGHIAAGVRNFVASDLVTGTFNEDVKNGLRFN